MFKKHKVLLVALILLLSSLCIMALKPYGMTHLTSLWIGDKSQTADVTPGDNDLFVYGTIEVDGNARFDGTISGSATRYIPLQLAAAYIDGTGVMGNDGTTTPGLATVDSIPAIVYATSAETNPIQWTHRLPADYASGLTYRMLISSGAASGAQQSIDWFLWDNSDDVTFDAASIAQTVVVGTNTTINASCEEFVFVIDATGEAAFAAGDWVTAEFFPAGSSDSTTEIKGLIGEYTTSRF